MVFLRLFILLFLTAYSYGMGTQSGSLNGFGEFISALFFVTAPALYFLPTYEAFTRKHTNLTSILLINLLLGWSLIGWVVALIWAMRKAEPVKLLEPVPVRIHEPEVPYMTKTVGAPNLGSIARYKTCPFCAEQVLEAAIKCKHCGSDLTPR
jgi:hypothetical protein